MEDLKIRVNSEAESEEAQCLFFELGYRWLGCHGSSYFKINDNFKYITAYMRGMSLAQGTNRDAKKEITIPQLRDMVVLRRNDPKDENVYQDGDAPCLYNLYLTSDKNLYFFFCGKGWKLSAINDDDDYRKLLKPIAKEPIMKEFLDPANDHKFIVTDKPFFDWIEVPEGAESFNYFDNKDNLFFLMGSGEGAMFSNELSD